ncbi:hypothetical protein SRABI106_02849 [Rahnella aquatilis]|nr:hypothetical protein SRABI106_02849 [Rahnella aquatilis]
MWFTLSVRRQVFHQNDHRHQADRHVHPKHHRPRKMGNNKRSHQRADNRRNAPYAGQISLRFCPFLRAVHIGNQRGGYRRDCPCTQSLQGTKADHPAKRRGESAQNRADQKQRGTDEKHFPATIQIRQPPVDGYADRLRQQIDGKHPAEQREPTQIANNGRHRRRDNGHFYGGHKHRQHAGGKD